MSGHCIECELDLVVNENGDCVYCDLEKRVDRLEYIKSENERLKAQLEKAKEGLRFYADPDHYQAWIFGEKCDWGTKARKTLKEIGDE